ncbi:hypothetical protein LZL87_010632 [Fusarium oxysporum]|nr:hypothetical protein LZL87_010632 [Fusarium oxysporum]
MFNPSHNAGLDRNYKHKIKKAYLNVIAGRGIRTPKDASMKARDNHRKHYAMIRQVTGLLPRMSKHNQAINPASQSPLSIEQFISSKCIMATTHDAISAIPDVLPPELIGHVSPALAHIFCRLTSSGCSTGSLTWRIRLILRGPGGERYADQNSDSGIQEFCSGVKNITEFQILGLPFFTGSWQILALERILGAAQNLEMFEFFSDGYSYWHSRARSQVSPTQLIEFLSPRTRKTLQRLSLNFDGRVEPGQRNLPKPKPITPQQIKHFTNLSILEVDSSCFYSHVLHRNKNELIVEQETYLVDFLPQTVQSLTIFFNRWARYELLHDITYLGQLVASGRLSEAGEGSD